MSHKIRALFALLLSASPSACAGGSKKPEVEEAKMGSSRDEKPPSDKAQIVPQQLLVAFEDAKASDGRAAIFAKFGAREVEKVGSSELYLIELPPKADLKATQASLKKEKGVRYAEPNLIMRTFEN